MSSEISESNIHRTQKVKNHIYLSILLRGISMSLSFLVVPMTLQFLGKELYGIWIVMLSIMSWIALFDIGIGNGLRNKLTEALAENNTINARKYITTAYSLISIVALVLLIFTLLIIPHLHWQTIFNTTLTTEDNLVNLMRVFLSTLIISFVFGLINPILNAFQLSSYTNIIGILTNIVFIILITYFSSLVKNNLLMLTIMYCLSVVFSNITVNLFFFIKKKNLIPKYSFFEKTFSKDILLLGGSFFMIQIAALLIFTVDNFLILQLLGAQSVSLYNITFKLFSIFTIGFGIIITPLWSAFTDAYVKKDVRWMRKTIKTLNLLLIPIILGLIVVVIWCQNILNLWLPKTQIIHPTFVLIISLAIFIFISIWNNIYSFFLNGISETKLQFRTAIFGAIINIPLAYFFVKIMGRDVEGIVWAMCISLSIFSIFGSIKSFKILNTLENEQ